MKAPDKWWTAPAEAESGRTILVTGRDGVEPLIESGKYQFRIEVGWEYTALPDGMPDEESARTLEAVTDALASAFRKCNPAVLTGIYTGDGRRDWVFYCINLGVFSKVFNSALAQLPLLPLQIEAESDPEWEEYRQMRDMTYIPDED